jgi:hypothetical protein
MNKKILFIALAIFAGIQTLNSQVIYGPEAELPGGVFSEMSGTPGDNLIGTAAGKDLTFSAIDFLDQTQVYFGTILDSVKLSLDGADFASGDTVVQEVLQFSPEMSNLDSGLLAWTGITRIPESAVTPVYTKFYMRFTTDTGKVSLLDASSVGLDPYVGGVPDLAPGAVFTVNLQFLASYSMDSASYVPHIPFYDVYSLSDGLAYSSFGWGWYWNNSSPELEENLTISVNEMDTVSITEQFLKVSDVESDSTMVYFKVIDVPEALPANGAVYNGSVMLNMGSVFTRADLMNDRITYVHDGSETLKDSLALRVYDYDGAYYSMGDDTTFYFVFAVTPVDDIPLVEVNEILVLDEEAEMALSSASLLTTDSESAITDITYTFDPADEGIWPKNGLLRKSGVPLSGGDTFTQDDIENALITYKHDGTMTTSDGVIFSVVDEFGHPAEKEDGTELFFFEITVTPVNDNPVFSVNVATELDAWGEVTISTSNLAATDEESDNSGIFFKLNDGDVVSVGEIRVDGVALEGGDSFSMQDLIDGNVSYKNFNEDDVESESLVFSIIDEHGGMAADGDFTIFNHNIVINLTGKEAFEISGISVYPNPGQGVFRVSGAEGAESYEVYSSSGQAIRSEMIDQNQDLIIDISNESKGIYLLQLKDAGSVVGSYSLVVL